MKPITYTSSNDEVLAQKVIRNGLIALSLAIVFLSGIALWTVFQVDIYAHKVESLSAQAHRLHMLHIHARERSLLLYRMVTEEDYFLKDKHRMNFYSEGSKFVNVRAQL